MRLWHKKLISVLPRQQLLSQWRECCCIMRSICINKTPNHLLVNKVTEYPIEHFYTYSYYVRKEMLNRGYKCDSNKFLKWYNDGTRDIVDFDKIFYNWHTDRYFKQCFYNLQEKYDCGGIDDCCMSKINTMYSHIKGD